MKRLKISLINCRGSYYSATLLILIFSFLFSCSRVERVEGSNDLSSMLDSIGSLIRGDNASSADEETSDTQVDENASENTSTQRYPYSSDNTQVTSEANEGSSSDQSYDNRRLPTTNDLLSLSSTVKIARPSVVNIFTKKRIRVRIDPFFEFFFNQDALPDRWRTQTNLGSGVIFSTEGHIITNHHVIQDADEILVALDGGVQLEAVLVGSDPRSDLAVIKIDDENMDEGVLTPIRTASSEAEIGDIVLAIGNPFGVGQSVSQGIVSALKRDLGTNLYEEFIQTDAAINPGNSGGALVNSRGELIGINTAIYSRSGGSQGVGFAIPLSLVNRVVPEIIESGKVSYGFIGVYLQELSPTIAESLGASFTQGAVITNIIEGSPAAQAGLDVGDIITSLNNQKITSASEVIIIISEVRPGDQVDMVIWRENQYIDLKVSVASEDEGF